MNKMQEMSQNLYRERLMLQMGIDPRADIDVITLRGMWRRLQIERMAERAKAQAAYIDQLEAELAA